MIIRLESTDPCYLAFALLLSICYYDTDTTTFTTYLETTVFPYFGNFYLLTKDCIDEVSGFSPYQSKH